MDEIRQRIDETVDEIIRQTRLHSDTFCWSEEIPTPKLLAENRLASMNRFLDDLDQGREEGRYIVAELPSLPAEDGSFDLAVSSHLLFHYSEHLTEQFHLDSVRELSRVACEVRIFPLLELGGRLSRHLDAAIDFLKSIGKTTTVEQVDYEFQRGATQMLRIR
ncbi:MAG: class I SAM-dependent methyltransferase [Planctomycetaceae bacterium]